MADHEGHLREILRRRLRDAGVASPARGRAPTLRVALGGRRFEVELRSARDARLTTLRALLAEAILEARAHEGDMPRLPFVGAPAISDLMAQELREFAERVAPGEPLGIVDGRGRLLIVASPDQVDLPPTEEPRAAAPSSRRPTLFSDAHQWILKVLLAPGLPGDLLTAPRPGLPVRSARGLASLARVSLTSAARFVAAFEAEGHIERSARWLRLVRVEELLQAWRTANRPRSVPIGLRWLIAPGARGGDVARLQASLVDAGVDACVGLHGACAALGHAFVSGAKPLLFVADARAALSALRAVGLVPSDDGTPPDVFLDVPAAPRSCFAGAVERDGRRVTDVLQTWLDVSWHPARGQEQAEVLWERVLAPRLLSSSEGSQT